MIHRPEFDIVIILKFLIIFTHGPPCILVVIEGATPLELLLRELVFEDRRLQARLFDDVLVKPQEKEKHLVLLFLDLECHW